MLMTKNVVEVILMIRAVVGRRHGRAVVVIQENTLQGTRSLASHHAELTTSTRRSIIVSIITLSNAEGLSHSVAQRGRLLAVELVCSSFTRAMDFK